MNNILIRIVDATLEHRMSAKNVHQLVLKMHRNKQNLERNMSREYLIFETLRKIHGV